MPADQADQKLRFDAGRFEDVVLNTVIFSQFMLLVMAAVIGFGWLYFTVGTLTSAKRTITEFIGAVPVVVVMVVIAVALGYLYESE